VYALSKDQLLAVLAAAKAKRTRDWLMFLVAYHHGLRRSEVAAIKADDIRDGFLSVSRKKGSSRTIQPLLTSAEPLLDEGPAIFEYIQGMAPNQKLFGVCGDRIRVLFAEYAAAAGLPSHLRHPHCLKHTIAMQIVGKVGVENTRIWLGHKSMASTGEYAKPSEQDAARAVVGVQTL
jgi:integrase